MSDEQDHFGQDLTLLPDNFRREPRTVEDYKAIVQAQEYKLDSLREALVRAMAKLYVHNRLTRRIIEILVDKARS